MGIKELEAKIQAGVAALRDSQIEQAEQLFRQALEMEPTSASAYCNLGMIELLRQSPQKAIPLLAKAVQYDDRLFHGYLNLGSAHFMLSDLAMAEQNYTKAAQLEPQNIDVHLNLGVLYGQAGQLEKARQAFERVLKLNGHFFQALFLLSSVYLETGDHYPALANVLGALRLESRHIESRILLAEIYRRMGRYDAAEVELKQLLEDIPDLQTPLVRLGIIYVETDRHNEALALFEQAIIQGVETLQVYELCGILYEERGDIDKAQETYQQILLMEPTNANALSGLERIQSRPNIGATLLGQS